MMTRKILAFLLLPFTMNAAVTTFQVTIGASATQVTASPIYCRWVVFQNNAAHSARIGDSLVSSSRGILMASGTPGGGLFLPATVVQNNPSLGKTYLPSWYIAGTQGDVIDVLCDVE